MTTNNPPLRSHWIGWRPSPADEVPFLVEAEVVSERRSDGVSERRLSEDFTGGWRTKTVKKALLYRSKIRLFFGASRSRRHIFAEARLTCRTATLEVARERRLLAPNRANLKGCGPTLVAKKTS